MANINLRDIILDDHWYGYVNPNQSIPEGGFDSTTGGNDVTEGSSEAYPLGTKIAFYTDGTYIAGNTVMTYLKLCCVSGKNDIEDISSGWAICAPSDNTTTNQTSSGDGTTAPYLVTNSAAASDATKSGRLAIACGTMTSVDSTTADTGRLGWFWTGGICPYIDITFFDGQSANAGTEITTDDNVVCGMPVGAVIDTSQITLGLGDATSALECGISQQTDA